MTTSIKLFRHPSLQMGVKSKCPCFTHTSLTFSEVSAQKYKYKLCIFQFPQNFNCCPPKQHSKIGPSWGQIGAQLGPNLAHMECCLGNLYFIQDFPLKYNLFILN